MTDDFILHRLNGGAFGAYGGLPDKSQWYMAEFPASFVYVSVERFVRLATLPVVDGAPVFGEGFIGFARSEITNNGKGIRQAKIFLALREDFAFEGQKLTAESIAGSEKSHIRPTAIALPVPIWEIPADLEHIGRHIYLSRSRIAKLISKSRLTS
jgi:hypothetical protein